MINKTIVMIIILMVIVGCESANMPVNQQLDIKQVFNETLPLTIAELPLMEDAVVDSADKYISFAETMNALIKILNEQADLFEIPYLTATREAWEDTSRVIAKYSPLIDNYNEVILTAQQYRNKLDEKNLKQFYLSAGALGIEVAFIVATLTYSVAFRGIGILYRSVGLNRFALVCGSCVSIMLSAAHWTARTAIVESLSSTIKPIFEAIARYHNIEGIINPINATADK